MSAKHVVETKRGKYRTTEYLRSISAKCFYSVYLNTLEYASSANVSKSY